MSRIFKKREKCSVRENLKSCFLVFFLFTFSHNQNLLCFNTKKDIICLHIFEAGSKNVFHMKLTWIYQKNKCRKVTKYFLCFFFVVYEVHCAIIGGNLAPIGAYSRTAQNRRKWATIYLRVRYYRDIRNTMYSTPPPWPPQNI